MNHLDSDSAGAKRRWRRAGLAAVIGAAVLTGLPFLALQWAPVATAVTRALVARIDFAGATLRIGRIDLSGIRSVTVDDVTLVRASGDTALALESGSLRYALLPLIRGSFVLSDLELVRPFVSMRRDDSGAWWLVRPGAESPTEATASPARPFRVMSASVINGRLEARLAPDSVHGVRDLDVTGLRLDTRSGFALELTRASARLEPAGAAPDWGRLEAHRLKWDGGRASADTLIAVTAGSRLTGSGTLGLLDDESRSGTQLEIRLEPLALADLRPLLPQAGEALLSGRVGARGAENALAFEGAVDTDDGGRIELAGRLEREPVPRLVLRGDAVGVDPSRIVAFSGLEGRLALSLDADLTGPDRSRLTGHADLRVGPSALAGTPVDELTIESRFRDGRAHVQLSGASGASRLAGDADLDLTTDTVQYTLDAVLDLREVRGVAASGRLALKGAGPPTSGVVAFEAQLDSARLGNTALTGGAVKGTLVGDSLAARLDLRSGPGRVGVTVFGRPVGPRPALSLRDGRARGVDLVAAGIGNVRTDLNLEFRGEVDFREGRPPRTRLRVDVDSSVVVDQHLHSGRLDVVVAERSEIRGTVGWNDGTIQVDAVGEPLAEPVRYRVREVGFQALDLSRFPHLTDWATDLNGSARFEGVGIDPATLVASGDLTLEPSRVNSGRLTGGQATVSAERGRLSGDVTVELEGGRADLRGTASLGDQPTWEARGTLDLPRLGPLLGDTADAAFRARFTLDGSGRTLPSLRGRAQIDVDLSEWRAIRADSARIDLRVDDGSAFVDALRLHSNVVIVEGSGSVPLGPSAIASADFRGSARLVSLEPLETSLDLPALVAARGDATLTVRGPADSLDVRGSLEFGALSIEQIRAVGLSVDGGGRYRPGSGWMEGWAQAELAQLTLPTATIERTVLSAEWEPDSDLLISGEARIDDRRTAELNARLAPEADRSLLTLERFRFSVDEDHWTLAEPARVLYGDGVDVAGLVLVAPGQRIAVEGSLDTAGVQAARISVDSLRVETVADLLGFEDLAGTLNASLDVAGTGSGATGRASVDFDVLTAGARGRVRVEGEIEDGRVAVDGTIAVAGSESLGVSGTLPLDVDSGEPVDLRIRADSFQIAFANALLDPELARDLAGRLTADVVVRGTPRLPRPDGSLSITNARVHLPHLGRTFREIDVHTHMTGDVVRIDGFRARSGDGEANVTGELRLEEGTTGRYDLAVQMDEFHAVSNELVSAVVSGALEVSGAVEAPRVSGRLSVDRGDLFLREGLAAGDIEDVVLTEDDYEELEAYFGIPISRQGPEPPPLFELLALDLQVAMQRDVWLRQSANPELAVQLTGDLQIQKEAGPDMALLGELEAVPARSYVEQFGRRFRLREGVLTFRGAPLDTRLDLEATYDVPSRSDDEPEVVVILGLEGDVGDLRIILGSEPAMESADVVSYLATGRPASRSFAVGGEGDGLLTRGGELAMDRVTGLLEGLAAERVGLDVVEIRREGLEAATLVAGRYVSPFLYLGFQQPVALRQGADGDSGRNDRTRVEVELQAYRWLLLNLQSGGDALQFFLRTRYGY